MQSKSSPGNFQTKQHFGKEVNSLTKSSMIDCKLNYLKTDSINYYVELKAQVTFAMMLHYECTIFPNDNLAFVLNFEVAFLIFNDLNIKWDKHVVVATVLIIPNMYLYVWTTSWVARSL